MRYHNLPPENWTNYYGQTYRCNHPVYRISTLYLDHEKGLCVIQQRFNEKTKSTTWSAIDPWLNDKIYLHAGFKEYFDHHAKKKDAKDARSVLKEPTSDMVEDKLLCYEPISKRYFHATEAALLEAFYSLNRDFALNGYASMNDLYNYLGLDYIPEGDLKGWCADYLAADWEYFWIDFSYLKQKTDDGLEVYYVEAYQEPIDDYLNYDPSKDTPF